jgi:hypothetical protein
MTVTLNLKPEVESGLLAQAEGTGMSLEEYLLSMLEGVILPAMPRIPSPEQRAAASAIAPPLPCRTTPSAAKPYMKAAIADARSG